MGETSKGLPLSFFNAEDGVEVRENEVGGDGEVAISGNDEIGVFAGRFDISIVHGTRGIEVLMGDGFEGAPAFFCLAVEATDQANIGWGIYENFHVHGLAQGLFGQDENAFDDDDGAGNISRVLEVRVWVVKS